MVICEGVNRIHFDHQVFCHFLVAGTKVFCFGENSIPFLAALADDFQWAGFSSLLFSNPDCFQCLKFGVHNPGNLL